MDKPRIAIVGAGAVGAYAGSYMAQAGHDVTFIDPWPEHVEAMRVEVVQRLAQLLDQTLARDRLAIRGEQEGEHAAFRAVEIDRAPGRREQLPLACREPPAGSGVLGVCGRGRHPHAPEHATDGRHDNGGLDRLGQPGIRHFVQCANAFGRPARSRQHHDAERRPGAQVARDRQPVLVGKTDVDDGHVERRGDHASVQVRCSRETFGVEAACRERGQQDVIAQRVVVLEHRDARRLAERIANTSACGAPIKHRPWHPARSAGECGTWCGPARCGPRSDRLPRRPGHG